MRDLNIAVIGATGMVGVEFLRILEQHDLPVGELRLLASVRSAGKKLSCRGKEHTVQVLSEQAIAGVDLAFISATDEISREWAPLAVRAGAVVIDDSGVFRMEPKVPLVVPEINPLDVDWHAGILSIPNCSTTPVALALWPLHRKNPVRRIVAATYQSVSGTGRAAVSELLTTTRAVLDGRPAVHEVYPHPIAFNLLPHIGSFKDDGYTSEEWKMVRETRKIFHDESIAISSTCVRVPVQVGHSVAVWAELSRPMSPDEARGLLRDAPGIAVQDAPFDLLYPEPRTAAGRDPVFVGRIRSDLSHPNGITFFAVADNLRKGAALNAIQIAEELLRRGKI